MSLHALVQEFGLMALVGLPCPTNKAGMRSVVFIESNEANPIPSKVLRCIEVYYIVASAIADVLSPPPTIWLLRPGGWEKAGVVFRKRK